jgi:hypothetical protein
MAVTDCQGAADILAYWHAVELFDPHDIPRPPRRAEALRTKPGTKRVEQFNLRAGEQLPPLPWQPGHLRFGEQPEQGRFGSVWRHTVYGGVFSTSAVREALASVLGYPAEEDYAGTQDGSSALFAVTVDQDGVPLDDTTSFSSCAWATGRLYDPGPDAPEWLDGFDELTGMCEEALYRLLARPVRYLPLTSSCDGGDQSRGWLAFVTDILGATAAGAVTALIGSLAPALGGVAGAGALAGAAGSLINRATQRAEDAVQPRAGASESGQRQAVAASAEPERRSLQVPDIAAFAAHVADILHLPSGLANHLEIRVDSVPVYRKKDGTLPDPEAVFLTSAIAADLKRVADAVRADEAGVVLRRYLSCPGDAQDRIDVQEDRQAILSGVRPDIFAAARWPADIDKPLVVGQQFAVNAILDELADGGLFAVNGPPGTGKTTLLRDLIAAIIAQRAAILAGLSSPADAFTRSRGWQTPEGERRSVRQLREELTGFEVVVASSNNAAVENITKELPAVNAIGAGWRHEADYFAEVATAFLGETAWGTVAAPLGNADKRCEFRERFWWGGSGMHEALKTLEAEKPPDSSWREAVDRYNQAVRDEFALAEQRTLADSALRSPVTDDELAAASARASAAKVRQEAASDQVVRAADRVRKLRGMVEAVKRSQDAHERSRPAGMRAALGIGDATRWWRDRSDEIRRELAGLRRDLQKAEKRHKASVTAEKAAFEEALAANEELRDLETYRQEDDCRIPAARQQWGERFPECWLTMPAESQELAAPWSDEEWCRARTRVFLAALDLHRAFIAGAARTIRLNLLQLVKALSRDPDAPPPDAEFAAWQTLFLVVPVLSTTFASCGRLFRNLGQESVGWALIDEAGQAVPQAAAGLLWRARRAVVVGDPLQLEPICQVPGDVQDRLRTHFDVGRYWLPSSSSVQGIADQLNRFGMFVRYEDRDGNAEDVWVGSPLRVHRRCEQPMFGISNSIAYHGLMVYGTTEKPFPGEQVKYYPPSCWVDVTGESDGKWVGAQGDVVIRILGRLHMEFDVALDRIYVLSPFRDVVTRCRGLVRQRFSGAQGLNTFIDKHVGTVHTMQGKEADVVLFVLGTDPSRAKRARDWAASPVNLLNVAVSRARRRFFVIGSHAEWSVARNFDVLAAALPRHRWPNSDG